MHGYTHTNTTRRLLFLTCVHLERLVKTTSLTLSLEKSEHIILADGALDVAHDGAAASTLDLDTDLHDRRRRKDTGEGEECATTRRMRQWKQDKYKGSVDARAVKWMQKRRDERKEVKESETSERRVDIDTEGTKGVKQKGASRDRNSDQCKVLYRCESTKITTVYS